MPSGVTQNTSRLSGVLATTASADPGRADPAGASRKAPWSAHPVPGAAVHQFEAIAPSLVTQNTSKWSGMRAATAIAEPCSADPGGAILNGPWSPQPAPGAAAHHWLTIAPSGPTQNTSRLSAKRATAAMGAPGRAAPAGEMGKAAPCSYQPPSAALTHHCVMTDPFGATQNTSRLSGVRATVVTDAPEMVAPAATTSDGLWSAQPWPAAPAHH